MEGRRLRPDVAGTRLVARTLRALGSRRPPTGAGRRDGSRASGKARTDSDYDIFVVSDAPEQVKEIAAQHPLGRLLEIIAWTPEQFIDVEKKDPGLWAKLGEGLVLWGPAW